MRFAEMTWPEMREVPRDRAVVVVPLAACEQHSHHLPTFTDTILVTSVAEDLERRLPGSVLLLPTMWLGASDHHRPFGATLSLSAERHARLVADLLVPVLDDGFEKILLLNGHGGNIDTLHVALRTLQPRFPERTLCGASYWELAAAELAAIAEGPRKEMGHACEFETSMMLALRPELVRFADAADDVREPDPALRGLYVAEDFRRCTERGAVGHPTRATAEKGRHMLRVIGDRCEEVVRRLLAG